MSSNKQPGRSVPVGEQVEAPPDGRQTIPRFEEFVINGLTFRDIRHLPLPQRAFFENKVSEALDNLDPFLKCLPEKLREPGLSKTEIISRASGIELSDEEIFRLVAEDDKTTTVREPKEVKNIIFQLLDATNRDTLIAIYVLFFIRIRNNNATALRISSMGQLSPISGLGVPFFGRKNSLRYVTFVGRIWEYLLNNDFPFPNSSKVTHFDNIRLPKRLVDNLYNEDALELKGDRGGKTGRILGDEVTDINITERVARLSDGEYYIMEKIPDPEPPGPRGTRR